MKIKITTEENVSKVTFVPETEEEMRIMGTLRNHYFLGMSDDGTFPEYDGITSENNFVTSMRFKFNNFQ